ncbi:PREDICTED: lymphocyte-specific helicase-like, partial [Habropoda laboriosa]|uniref:lymphocyte-specific helicase-like n=1 Tax=Habropoda laboriosa TaxID=597456 RepID=UPI00083D07C0
MENEKSNKTMKFLNRTLQQKINLNKNNLNLNEEKIKNFEDRTEMIDSNVIKTPIYFNGDLRDYQRKGLQWLKILYENGLNGILADEMGLGKTIQIIALLCHLIEKQQDGPYLLIAPLSTIPNWLLEFEKFAPKLPVVLFHGQQDERHIIKKKIKTGYKITNTYSTLPIVLTSFEMPIHEQKFIKSLNWRYIIIDEGHRIKNHECLLIKILKSCKSMSRLLLTGTPLQNNLAELWSLLNFLLPEIFDDLAVFESWFDAKELQHDEGTKNFLKLEQEKHVLSSLREILQPFMLRREKSDVCLDIPPKKELIVYAPLTELQHNLYKAVLNYDIARLSKSKEEQIIYTEDGRRPMRKCVLKNINNTITEGFKREMSPASSLWESDESTCSTDETILSTWKQFTNITEHNREFLLKMRMVHKTIVYKKIVNHPYLIHYPEGTNLLPKLDEDIVRSSGKLLVLDSMLAKLKKQRHKVLLFSTMTKILDIIEDYLSLRNYKYVRLDGLTSLIERKENIKTFNTDPEVFMFLISTRAGGVGLNLVGADTVIMYDSDWNPQVDIQAMARCHRIGQTKPVMIYKLCTKGTLDEAIINRAKVKRVLEKMVISKHSQAVNVNSKTHLLELQRLLESKECQVMASDHEVFTEEELNKLLDRSDM